MTQEILKRHETNLMNAFMLAPAMICILHGPHHVFELANNMYMQLIGNRDIIDKPIREALPELEGQGFFELLDEVYKTGKTYNGYETLATIDRGKGAIEDNYFNFTFQASHNHEGNIEGILAFLEEVTEQVISRKKSEKSEKRFRNLVEQTTTPILILKGEKMVMEVANESVFKIFNVGKEALGKPFLEILPEMKDQPFIGLLLDVLHNGVTHYGNEEPAYFIRENGEKEIVYFNFVYQPYNEDDGKVSGVMVLANDVTELVLSRKKVEESEKRYNMMLMKSPFGFAIFKGKNMVITLANDSIKEFWGKGKDVEGKPLFEVLDELKDSTFPSLLENVYTTGNSFYGDELLAPILRNGKLEDAYFNFVYQPYLEADETISGVTIIAYEVTAQALVKKALAQQRVAEQKALKSIEESNTRYHSMLMHSPFAFCIMKGKDMVITLANDLIKEFWGKGMNVEGKTLLQVLPELKNQPFPELIDSVFTTGKPVHVNEILSQLQHEHTLEDKYFNIVYQPHYEADDTISGVISIAYDVTEMVFARKKIEESETFNRAVLESSPDCVKMLSSEGRLEFINPNGICLLEIDDFESVKDTYWWDMWEPKNQQIIKDAVAIAKIGEKVQLQLFSHTTKGTPKWWDIIVLPMHEVGGDKNLNRILSVSRDITEQKQYQLKELELLSRFQNLVQQAPVAICVLRGKNYIIEIINERMYEMVDRTLAESLNKPVFEVLPELMEQGIKNLLDNVYHTGERFVAEELPVSLKRKGKLESAYVKFVYEPLREADGTVSGVMALAHEITEQVLSRKKIEESETKFRTLIEDAPVATCFFSGREMKIEVANDIMLGYWGKGKEVIEKKLADAVPELKGQPFLKILDDVFTTGKIYEAKNAFAQLESNGVLRTYYFDFTYKPIRNAAGEIYGIMNMSADVTEQVLSRKKLEASEEQFSTMANNISQFAWMTDEKGYIYWYNQRWYDYTGTTLEETQGSGWQKILHPDMVEEVIGSIKKSIEEGTDWEYTFLLRGKDGMYRWFLSRAVPVRDNDGKVIRWFGTNTDITEQKEAGKKAEEATLMAEDAMKAKQQFLSNMSHEIRTPMNAIIGFTNVVLKTKLDEKQKEYINAIKASGDSLIVLINDILDLAKVDAGKMTFHQIPFKLSESITAMLHLFEIKIQEKDIELVKQYDTAIPEILLGDPARLHQIIINLISNAIKFTTKGKITLSVRLLNEDDEKASIEFSITDTGIGIPENKLEDIFDAFEQASSETSQFFGGSGLGLAIVKQLVEPQGGTLSVKSKVGKGSTFSFVMGFKKTALDTAIEAATPSPPMLKNIKILMVEDVKLNQLLMKIILEDFGVEVDLADNGRIAVEKLKTNNYNLIFMDLQMPEMNGFEATEYIRNKMNSQIPIIALTADVTTMDVEKCKAIGMNDYISKPIDEKLLYAKIIKYLPKPKD